MATLKETDLGIAKYEERVCIFCGEQLIEGCVWAIGADIPVTHICVGNCCKDHLIDMYKDVILDQPYEDLFHFKKRIFRDIEEVYQSELKRQLIFENRKIKKAVKKKLKYESEIKKLKGE